MSKAQFGFHLSVQGLLASTCPSANTAPLRVPFLPNRDWDRVAAANTRAAQNTLGFDSHVGTLYHASYNFAASGALTFGPSIVGSTTAATQANLSEHSAISLPELNQAPQSQAIPHNPPWKSTCAGDCLCYVPLIPTAEHSSSTVFLMPSWQPATADTSRQQRPTSKDLPTRKLSVPRKTPRASHTAETSQQNECCRSALDSRCEPSVPHRTQGSPPSGSGLRSAGCQTDRGTLQP